MANQTIVKDTPIQVGDLVRVFYRIVEHEVEAGKTKREVKEKTRERLQPYEGVVIGIRGEGDNRTFTVRRIGVDNIGIERIFPVVSPWIEKIKVKSHLKVRRAKLNFLRKTKEKLKLSQKKSVQK